MGVYVSPWDQNHPAYGTPEYNEVFAATLREVLTGYGEVFEQWLDGANGEGPDGRRQEYDWALFHNTIRECQPNAVIFSDVGPDCRWIGNERGVAGETNWSRLHTEGFTPGLGAPAADSLNRGNVHGATWVPGEADVSIRPGWFYSPSTDDKVKSVEELMSIYLSSVGRNANLLLNVPPDRTGRINAVDSARLMEFRAAREAAFGIDLAAAENGATVERSDDAIVVSLPSPATVNYIALGEDITQGQRIARFEVSYMNEASGEWLPLTGGTTIGHKRILHVDPVTVKRVRIEIESSLAPPVISTVSLY
jgi:alpha-L-fucosidase